ncbi:MAG: hypothetical protein HIU87_12835 [Acidobacteria bacterium]|nr:hypothetical protein [Acidobacteriota bacterium]
MNKSDEAAIQSGAARVDEVEDLISGYSAPRESSDTLTELPGSFGDVSSGIVLSALTLSMFLQNNRVIVRVGNALNGSQLYECSYPSIEEANEALLDSRILHPEQVADRSALAGIDITLQAITEGQLVDAGLKRRNVSTL